jgi:hypothetical protein
LIGIRISAFDAAFLAVRFVLSYMDRVPVRTRQRHVGRRLAGFFHEQAIDTGP